MSIFSNSLSSALLLRGLLAAGLAGAALLWPQIGMAQSEGPFANFVGSWRGSGEVVGTDGNRERISCRANYTVSESGEGLTQTLVCASDSYRLDISSYVIANGQSVQGHWQEATRQVQGHLSGHVADGQFEGSVAGPGFTAEILLRTNGRKQNVNIRPKGGNVAEAEVVLSREN